MTITRPLLGMFLGLSLGLNTGTAEELMPPPPPGEASVLMRTQAPPNRLDNTLQVPPTQSPTFLPGQQMPGNGLPLDRPVPKPPERFIGPWKFDLTVMPESGDRGFGMVDLEGSVTFNVPLDGHLPPLLITPGAAVRLWNGPDFLFFPASDDGRLTLYDLYVDFGWRPRVAEWLFLDLGLTPGIYSDFSQVDADSFFLRGRAIGIVAFSEQFQIVAGLLYVNRLSTTVIPALGFVWNPSPETKVQLVFPQPKISHRFHCANGVEWWGYVAGDFGGGTWTFERLPGQVETVDYSDWRFLFGLEMITDHELRGRIEAGVAFNRELEFDNVFRFRVEPDSSFLLRVGISY